MENTGLEDVAKQRGQRDEKAFRLEAKSSKAVADERREGRCTEYQSSWRMGPRQPHPAPETAHGGRILPSFPWQIVAQRQHHHLVTSTALENSGSLCIFLPSQSVALNMPHQLGSQGTLMPPWESPASTRASWADALLAFLNALLCAGSRWAAQGWSSGELSFSSGSPTNL